MILEARDLVFRYGRGRPVLDGAACALAQGELVAIVGPNGAGKSTLLRCLHGGLRPESGAVRLRGADLAGLSRREVARALAVVPQRCEIPFPTSVGHFVGLGRFAHESFLGGESALDREIVARCLAELDLQRLAQRSIQALSGGEFRRVLIAQALAQEPAVLLFDEPVQQLDPRHQIEIMGFARAFARQPGKAALVVLHDLTLAARYCDRLVVLVDGRVLADGRPEEVLDADTLRRAFGVETQVERDAATGTLRVTVIGPARAGVDRGAKT